MKVITIIWVWLITAHCYPGRMDWDYAVQRHQQVLQGDTDCGFGLNEPFIPTPAHILPEKKPFPIDESVHYYERHFNGSGPDGTYRRSSCPAVNALANRGYINRTGRNISYSELTHAVRRVWNFADDNVTPPSLSSIRRPFPEGDQNLGRDICPMKARFQREDCGQGELEHRKCIV
ncbi:unnamed protein product [Aspergillus oryzae]|nr:unnamed protein product [Aspergillus oryzae]GMF86827.1 unnamed protein product [Aspergillus oryzae]